MEHTITAAAVTPAELNKERNLRYIYAKLPFASPSELALIAGFIRGMRINGWYDGECNRHHTSKEILRKEETA